MRRRHKMWIGFGVIAIALIAVRMALPYWVADELNQRLDKMGDYHGELGSVDLSLYRGAYQINRLTIVKNSGDVPVPLLTAPLVDLSISWKEIFNGALVAEVEFRNPELNFVDGGDKGEGQAGGGVDWREQLESLLPIHMNEVRVVDGTIAFRNLISDPPVDLRMTDVDLALRNLTNVRDADGRRDASLDGTATVLDDAAAEFKAKFDPLGKLDDFSFDMRVVNVNLTRLNTLTQAYANLDIASGQGDFVMELDAEQGRLRGYAKPLLHKLDIFSWKQDVENGDGNPLQMLWEAFSSGVTKLFQNHPTDQFATKIMIDGSLDKPGASTLQIIGSILRNAFVEAYRSQFEGTEIERSGKDKAEAP
ncbi:MAG: DUF748 domain-containing protein [Pseudomonadota bacterium]|nr:DUF748 domain-containing protein [Pseudomonadota bacterium]